MIKTLIVDDNNEKAEKIGNLLDSIDNHQNIIHVDYAKSQFGARQLLMCNRYDVLLLDLVLPLRDSSEPDRNGGQSILTEISLGGYKQPSHVFVISEYEDAIQQVSNIAPDIFFSSINYCNSSDEWLQRLNNYFQQIVRADAAACETSKYDACIICALDSPELGEIKRLPFSWKPFNLLGDTTDYYQGQYRGHSLLCASSYEMGLSSAAVLSTRITEKFHPKYLCMTGIAGGVKTAGLGYGDVIFADPSFDYESGKKTYENGISVFKPDYRQIRLDTSVVNAVKRISSASAQLDSIFRDCTYSKPASPFQVKIGSFGAGASVLSDSTVIDRVLSHSRKLLAFDMESYAVMLSGTLSTSPKTIPIVLKGISDFGEGKSDTYQEYASYTSAKVLQLLLDELFS